MCSRTSLPNRPIAIAKLNRNVPSMHRLFRVPDHLFQFEIDKPRVPSSTMLLNVMMEEFDNLIKYNIEKVPIGELRFESYELYKEEMHPGIMLETYIETDENTVDYVLDPALDNKHIYLCRHFITNLNESIGLVKELDVLQICCNYLYKIPYSIKNLTKLKLLILSRNRLRELPEEIGCCRDLREIDVSSNQLTALPKSIASLKQLNTLQISNNKFDTLPPEIGKMVSLKYLHFSNNPVCTVPFEILKLPFLAAISYENCPFDFKTTFLKEMGQYTLLEIAARSIVRNNCKVYKNMSSQCRNHLLSVKECAFCGGPFFEYHFEVRDMHEFDGRFVPIHYSMCSEHYSDHRLRISTLFQNELETSPTKLLRDQMPNITELFEPYCHNPEQKTIAEREFDSIDGKIPLICLSLWNTRFYKSYCNEQRRDTSVFGWNSRIRGDSWDEAN